MKKPEYYGITRYQWIGDKLDVFQDVDLSRLKLVEIPFNFNIVHGDFYCHFNQLLTLDGCPEEVRGDFDCSHNELISLKNCPKEVYGVFDCSYNQLISLQYCPKEIKGSFDCSNNNLTSLEGFPKEINGYFDFSFNKIKTIKILPIVKGDIYSDFSIKEFNEMIRIESNKNVIRSKMRQENGK